MRKIERRAMICLILAFGLFIGICTFGYRFVRYGGEWASFPANKHLYTSTGTITDRDGDVLSSSGDSGRTYYPDETVRKATLHAVGDEQGNIGTGAIHAFSDKLSGYNILTGSTSPFSGEKTLSLTIDAAFNVTAYKALGGHKGTVGVYDYTTGETIDLKEEKITNAIIETTVAEKPKVYLLKGHEEITDLMTVATEYIENDVIDIEELDLLTTDMPDDCDCLIITNPSKDFTEGETNKIIDYINDGGNILWLNNAQTEKLPNVQKILDLYGVKIGNGVVRETDSNKMLPGAASFILPSLSTHKITEDIVDGYVILFNPTKLEFADDEEMEELGVTATPIIQSSETSYYRTDIENESSEKQDDEEEGPFLIAEELTKKVGDKESTLMVFGDGLFVSDTQIAMRVSSSASQKYNAINFRSNSDMLLNTINYLVERESSVTIRKNMEYVTYTATEQEDLTIRAIIFFIPLIIIIIGIIIWQRRRRRR